MKQLINQIKATLLTKPANAFLLLVSSFFFTQSVLLTTLYVKNPFGGWVTTIGTFTNASILLTSLLALSICLLAMLLSVSKRKKSKQAIQLKSPIIDKHAVNSPIDFPNGSTIAVVSGYSLA